MMKRCSWILLAALAACSPDGSSSKPALDGGRPDRDAAADKDAAAESDAGQMGPRGKGRVIGKVVDTDGHELGDIEIQAGGKLVKTDNRGIFEAKGVPGGQQQIILVDEKRSRAQITVEVPNKGTSQVTLTSIEYKSAKLADANAGGTIDTPEELAIKLPAKSLKDSKGKTVSGEVEARYAIVNDAKTLAAAPGGMKGEKNGKKVELETFGMADVGFYKGAEKLQLDKEAELTLPLGNNALNDGDEVDVWSFDELKGLWKAEGKAKVNKSGGKNEAKVKATHFSWWSVGKPLADKSCLIGTLQTATGAAVGDMLVNGIGSDYLTSLSTTTAEDGTFCMDVKLGSQNNLSAFGIESGSYFSWLQENVQAGTTPATCGGDRTGCIDVGTVMGNSLFAECTGNVTSDENHVLVLSSGDPELDNQLQALLQSYGNQATIGPQYADFDDTVSLDDYDVVYLQANYNWQLGDMPLTGQHKLINWINCGGGLVTVEWTVWKSGTGNQFQLLDAVYPMIPETVYSSSTSSTYVKVGNDPVIHNGLPDMFTFTADNYQGTEINLNARPGATVFYDSQSLIEGVVGWDFNLGRVVSVSTCAGPQSLGDPNYGRMMANIVDWLQKDDAHEPMVGQ